VSSVGELHKRNSREKRLAWAELLEARHQDNKNEHDDHSAEGDD